MSFSKQFLHDVFISYASANNEPPDANHEGLITEFHKKLVIELRSLGVGEGLEIFFDKGDVGCAEPLSDQILSAARASGVFIAFHSPAYDSSIKWCHREFHEFRESVDSWDSQLFVISLKSGFPPEAGPVFHGMSRHVRRYYEKREEKYFTFRTNRPAACNPTGLTLDDEIEDMAAQIAPILLRLRDSAPVKRIFLTCASDAWKPQADDIRNGFMGPGYQVLQTSPWIDRETRIADAERYIAAADLVVGVVESFNQGEVDDARVHCAEQVEIANRLGKPLLRWLPQNAAGFDEAELNALKARDDVKAVGLQEFKTMITTRLSSAPIMGIPAGGNGADLVMLMCAVEDEREAFGEIAALIDGLELGYDRFVDSSPLVEAQDIEAWCAAVKKGVGNFGATRVVFLDGNCGSDWIDARSRNYLVLKRDVPELPPAAICDCQPLPKAQPRGFRPRGRVQIFRHDDPQALETFLLT